MGKYRLLGSLWDDTFRNDLNANFDDIDTDIKVQKARVDNLITGNPQPEEVMDLRTDTDGVIHGTAWDRFASDEAKKTTKFQEIDAQLVKKATKAELNDIGIVQINKNKGLFDETYFSDTVKQQWAGTTPVNATPAPKSITKDRFANKALTAEKTDFFQLSTNLINPSQRFESKSIGVDTGNLTDNLTHDTSDFIEVSPSTTYTSNKLARKAFYDINKAFISTDTVDGTWTSPANAHYVRVVSLKTNWGNTTQLNLGNALLPFEPYYAKLPFSILKDVVIKPELTNFFNKSSNLYVKATSTDGVVIDSTGNIVTNASYTISDYIEVKPSTKYAVHGTLRASYFNSDKVYISRNETTEAYDSVSIITAPSTAKYVRLSVFMSRKDIAQMNEGLSLLKYEEGGDFIKTELIHVSKDETTKDFTIDSALNGTFNTTRQFDDYTTNGWATISSNSVYAMVDSLQSAHPNYITKQPLTPDLTGLEISAYKMKPQRPEMTNKKRYPTIFIVTGTHGYERSSVINMYHLVKEMCENWQENELIEALRFNVDIIWIPIVNPYGWTAGGGAGVQRYNSNGVDIARQFPDGWVKQDPASTTYGGEAPLTEIEALNVKQIFDENPNIDVFYDHHNFGDAIDEYIWLATASDHAEQLGEALIKKMTRKWTKEFAFIPDDTWLGYTSHMEQGTMHNYAYTTKGIKRSGTFETNNQFHLDTTSVKYNQDSIKAGLEAITNFLLINLRDLVS